MTIPELRKSFERLDAYLRTKRTVEEFQKEWKKIFGTDVSKAGAEEYLRFVDKQAKPAKGKSQSGGGDTLGAPIDQTTAAGRSIPYGNFPPPVYGGFGFANINSIQAQCGKEAGLWPTPPSGMGSNLVSKGGGRRSRTTKRAKKNQRGGASLYDAFSQLIARPMGQSSPPTLLQDAQNVARGISSPSPDPTVPSFDTHLAKGTAISAQIS